MKVVENKITSQFGAIAGQFRNVSGVELKTAGINTVTIQDSRLGTITIYDLAGQFEYYSSHGTLVEKLVSSSAAIFIAVVKLSESEAEVIQTLQYWISFIENCCSRVGATAHAPDGCMLAAGQTRQRKLGKTLIGSGLPLRKLASPISLPCILQDSHL